MADHVMARHVIVIDGGSGSGKTSLAHQLAAQLRPCPVTVVSLDDAYPGWDGLAAGSLMVPGMVTGARPGYAAWDWIHHRFAGWRDLSRDGVLIIEGCGALTPASRAVARWAIWCELDEQTRRERAIARDGDSFAREWDRWAAQERFHWQLNQPQRLADIVLTPRP